MKNNIFDLQYHTQQNNFIKQRRNEDFISQRTRAELIQHICTIRNVKGRPLGIRKMTDGNSQAIERG